MHNQFNQIRLQDMIRTLIIIAVLMLVSFMSSCSDGKRDAIGRTEVVIETSRGNITARLYDDTPLHRDNFIRMIEAGVYENIIWNRIVPGATIQTGEPLQKAGGAAPTVDASKFRHTIPAEIKFPRYFHKAGALAMCRQADDVNPDRVSSGTHFYIVSGRKYDLGSLAELWQGRRDAEPGFKLPSLSAYQKKVYTTKGGYPLLDGDYTIFGEVVDGMGVVESINKVPVDAKEHPLKEVTVKRIRVVKR